MLRISCVFAVFSVVSLAAGLPSTKLEPADQKALVEMMVRLEGKRALTQPEKDKVEALLKTVPPAPVDEADAGKVARILSFHGVLPCDPKTFKKAPKMVLHGEVHDGCELCARNKKKLVGAANDGTLLVGHEGFFFHDFAKELYVPSGKLRGVEDPLPYALTKLVYAHHTLGKYWHLRDDERVADAILKAFYSSLRELVVTEQLREVWVKGYRKTVPFEDKRLERLAATVDEAVTKDTHRKRLQVIVEDVRAFYGSPDYPKLLSGFLNAVVKYVPKTDWSKRYRMPSLDPVSKLLNAEKPSSLDLEQFLTDFAETWRNEYIFANGLRLYCEAGIAGLDLGMLFGVTHVIELTDPWRAVLKASGDTDATVKVDLDFAKHDHKDERPGDDAATKKFLADQDKRISDFYKRMAAEKD